VTPHKVLPSSSPLGSGSPLHSTRSMAFPTINGFSEAGQFLVTAVAAWLAYHLIKALYNISPLHPLSAVPGPRLAAMSYLPEFYHDVILNGRYTHSIKEMHQKYGNEEKLVVIRMGIVTLLVARPDRAHQSKRDALQRCRFCG
jgi:hypothetical protein